MKLCNGSDSKIINQNNAITFLVNEYPSKYRIYLKKYTVKVV